MLSSIVDRPLVATLRVGSRRERSPRRGTSRARGEESAEALPAHDRSQAVEVGERQDELAVQGLKVSLVVVVEEHEFAEALTTCRRA